jgi:hypothetical protein
LLSSLLLSYTTEKPVPSQDKVLISRLEARTRYGSPEDESSDEDQDDEELIPSPKEVRSDLEVLLTTPSGIIKTFVLDIAMGNPAAPRFFQGGKTPHLTPDTANDARDQEKLDHYGTHTTLVGRTPKVYYTFNVEATGRLGPSALAFLQDIFSSAGKSYDLDGISARFGPSPVMKLLRNIVPAVARINAKLSKAYTRYTA